MEKIYFLNIKKTTDLWRNEMSKAYSLENEVLFAERHVYGFINKMELHW